MKHPFLLPWTASAIAFVAVAGCGGGGSMNEPTSAAPPVASNPTPIAKTDLTTFAKAQLTSMPQSMNVPDSVEPSSIDNLDVSIDDSAPAAPAMDDESSTTFADVLAAP